MNLGPAQINVGLGDQTRTRLGTQIPVLQVTGLPIMIRTCLYSGEWNSVKASDWNPFRPPSGFLHNDFNNNTNNTNINSSSNNNSRRMSDVD
jgi:hypothetical protein